MYRYIWLVPLLPLAGAAVNGLLGRRFRFSERLVGSIAVGSVALAFLISVAAVVNYGVNVWPKTYVTSDDGAFVYTWIPGGATELTEGLEERADAETTKKASDEAARVARERGTKPGESVLVGVTHAPVRRGQGSVLDVEWSYQLDPLSSIFMLIVTGVGLCIFVFATFGTTQYTQVFEPARPFPVELANPLTWGIMSWIALGLFVGACGKSAQIPLHVWLPDAMAGPTPVSALIHAATMVTAGLYMVTRTNVIFQHSQTMMLVVAVVGALTALFAATIGIPQNDIKKVLAYSTVSQLGFMFLACGVGAFVIGIFHVMTHAFFKALMFLGAGSVIHGMHHEQDMRKMGGLKKYMPYTYWAFMAGWLAICGIIPFSGFWSKDEILWRTASTNHIPLGWLVWLVGTIAATCTAFYMTRLMAMTFWGKERFGKAHKHSLEHEGDAIRKDHPTEKGHVHVPHESPKSMWVPLVVLAILATVGGFVGISTAFTGGKEVGGRMNIVTWLDPIIWNKTTHDFGRNSEKLLVFDNPAPERN